jgi:hypothetical protein
LILILEIKFIALAVVNDENGHTCKVNATGNFTTIVGNPKYMGHSFTETGNKMAFFFDNFDISFAMDFKTMYAFARNNGHNTTMPNSLCKVIFQEAKYP